MGLRRGQEDGGWRQFQVVDELRRAAAGHLQVAPGPTRGAQAGTGAGHETAIPGVAGVRRGTAAQTCAGFALALLALVASHRAVAAATAAAGSPLAVGSAVADIDSAVVADLGSAGPAEQLTPPLVLVALDASAGRVVMRNGRGLLLLLAVGNELVPEALLLRAVLPDRAVFTSMGGVAPGELWVYPRHDGEEVSRVVRVQEVLADQRREPAAVISPPPEPSAADLVLRERMRLAGERSVEGSQR